LVTIQPARIVKNPHPEELEASGAATGAKTPRFARGRVVVRRIVEAEQSAAEILARAEREARVILERAERDAAHVRLCAEEEGRADAAAAVAARAIALRAYEAQSEERQLDRLVDVAKLLAERLLGEALALDPTRVTSLARQALKEARGARRIRIEAHPDDASLLERSLLDFGVDGALTEVVPNHARSRGSLRIVTEIGILDAEIAPQLERLSLKLRESLHE
jgi:flagellar assembly protein FliH/type III secretion protein L